jgi:hypothetical protein
MKSTMQNRSNPSPFLESSEWIDWQHPAILKLALSFAGDVSGDEAVAQRCLEFVRDSIKHSWDYRLNPVTCVASDVLRHGTGYCYAKSHLLAALLRANGIPAGLCYQRLSLDGNGWPYCLHGLNAVYLRRHGWYRVDPRGNKPGVVAAFCPPVEQLAFAVDGANEVDLPGIYSQPLPQVVSVLSDCRSVEEVYRLLPDCDPNGRGLANHCGQVVNAIWPSRRSGGAYG